MRGVRAILIWTGLAVAIAVPLAVAASSPLLAWRGPVYIAAGFAGVLAMGLLLVQPLLAGGYLPGLTPRRTRLVHAWVGAGLVALVAIHVLALWLTSPPDVIDVLLFRSPTPFSIWGVIGMWTVFAAAILAALRRKLRLKPATWRLCHTFLVTVVIACSVVHAMLIEGTMGTISKAFLCLLVVVAAIKVMSDVKPWSHLFR